VTTTTLELIVTVYVALVGLVVGSYLNVLIHRLPLGRSTVLPRSRCPHCGALIRAWDNVPLFSFLFLRGRCRDCRTPISWRYPFVELLTAVGFVACYLRFGTTAAGLAGLVLWSLLIVLAAIDFDHRRLPDVLTLTGLAVGLAFQPWVPWTSLGGALIAALIGGGAFWVATEIEERLGRNPGFGRGDAKMVAMIGAHLGPTGAAAAIAVAALLAVLAGCVLAVRMRSGRETRLPFGTFLALGAALVLFFGTPR